MYKYCCLDHSYCDGNNFYVSLCLICHLCQTSHCQQVRGLQRRQAGGSKASVSRCTASCLMSVQSGTLDFLPDFH